MVSWFNIKRVPGWHPWAIFVTPLWKYDFCYKCGPYLTLRVISYSKPPKKFTHTLVWGSAPRPPDYIHCFNLLMIRWTLSGENMTKVAEYFEEDNNIVVRDALINELKRLAQNSPLKGKLYRWWAIILWQLRMYCIDVPAVLDSSDASTSTWFIQWCQLDE